jgi:hypothetical protein
MQNAKRVAAAVLAAVAVGHAQADSITFSEGFEDVPGLANKGWSFWNLSEKPDGDGWIQGPEYLPAEDGPLTSYAMTGYIASVNDSFDPVNISAWMVSPEIKLTGQDRLQFSIEGPGGSYYQDNLRIVILPGSATSPGDGGQTIFNIGSPPPFWLTLGMQLPENMSSVRIAFQYYGSNATANFLAIDSVSVTSAVPEPASALMLALGLGGVALLRRRKDTGTGTGEQVQR